jgi:molybdate transport system regulatory protein
MATRKRRQTPTQRLQLHGSLWMSVDGQDIGGHGRIKLLRAVAEQGSITRAAQAFGMSYKAAWDAINRMNELAGEPLVERVIGGRGGGSTQLTEHGRRVIARYAQVDAVHQRFIRLLDEGAMDLDEEFSLLKVLNVKTSARNQWVGSISAIRAGAVNDEVEVLLPGGARLLATVTRTSTETLGLRLKQTVIVLVKSSAVLLATGLQEARVSAGNRLEGVVTAVTPGAVNAEVLVEAEGGVPVVAIVTQASVEALGLRPGAAVTALVKASDLLLATAS